MFHLRVHLLKGTCHRNIVHWWTCIHRGTPSVPNKHSWERKAPSNHSIKHMKQLQYLQEMSPISGVTRKGQRSETSETSSGCWLTHPSEKYQSIGMKVPNIWENTKCSKPPTNHVQQIGVSEESETSFTPLRNTTPTPVVRLPLLFTKHHKTPILWNSEDISLSWLLKFC